MGDRPDSDGRGNAGFSTAGSSGSFSGDASITNSLYGETSPADRAGAGTESQPSFGPDESAGETSFTETRQVSWFEKMSDAVVGVLIGFVLVLVTAGVLFWNEGRAVQTSRSLTEGAGLVVEVASDRVDPAQEGKLVHLQGDLATRTPLADPALGVEAQAARLVRSVEMYQWKEDSHTETTKQLGGGEERRTTYSYHRVWSATRIASERFHQQAGHANPQPRYGAFETVAQDTSLGAFRPGAKAVGRIPADQVFTIDPDVATALRNRPGLGPVQAAEGGLYLGQDPGSPRVGDLRIVYRVAPLGPVSFVGRQVGSGLDEYQTKAGDRLLMARSGLVPAADMFAGAQAENTILTWIIRLVATVVMWIGFAMVLRPIAVVGDVIPIVGTILGAGTALAAFAMTAVLAPLVVAMAWLFYRPLVSVGILAVGFGIIYGVRWLSRQRRGAQATTGQPGLTPRPAT